MVQYTLPEQTSVLKDTGNRVSKGVFLQSHFNKNRTKAFIFVLMEQVKPYNLQSRNIFCKHLSMGRGGGRGGGVGG